MKTTILRTKDHRNRLWQFGESVRGLAITRWIFTGFSIIILLWQSGGILNLVAQKILGVDLKLTHTSSIDFADFGSWDFSILIALFIFFLFISIPKLIGNLLYVLRLFQLSASLEDRRLKNAFICQIWRVVAYFSSVMILLNLGSHYLHTAYGEDVLRFGQTVGYNGILGLILVLLSEKIANTLSWGYIAEWTKDQLQVSKTSIATVQAIEGSKLMFLGMLITFVDNLSGNLLFNVGCVKMAKGILDSSADSIVIDQNTHPAPIPVSPRIIVPPRQEQPRPQAYHPAPSSPLPSSTGANFCSNCGSGVISKYAQFCIYCGSTLDR